MLHFSRFNKVIVYGYLIMYLRKYGYDAEQVSVRQGLKNIVNKDNQWVSMDEYDEVVRLVLEYFRGNNYKGLITRKDKVKVKV